MEDNMDYIEVLKNFVSGQISFEVFEKIYFSDENLQLFLQDNLPKRMIDYADVRWYNGNINMALEKKNWKTKHGRFGVQCIIEYWLKYSDIDCYVTPIYREQSRFIINVKPDYINGEEAETFIDGIIESVPETMPKTKRIKEIKVKIKEAFHVEDRKYPRWAQDTDWPFSKAGKPLKYVSRKTDGDLVQHTFVDVDTGEETIVEEFY